MLLIHVRRRRNWLGNGPHGPAGLVSITEHNITYAPVNVMIAADVYAIYAAENRANDNSNNNSTVYNNNNNHNDSIY